MMIPITNTEKRFGAVSILLHWVMALIMIGLVGYGLYMTDLPISAQKLRLYGLHKEFGILVLMLALLRVVWRIANRCPTLAFLAPIERIAAKTVHWAFYIFMFTLPISGWLVTSSSGLPVSFFGLFVLPDLVAPSEDKRLLYSQIHTWLAYGLIVTFCLHVAAALKHHFINKDDILRRML